jgi:predicted Zn-dependent peptidase
VDAPSFQQAIDAERSLMERKNSETALRDKIEAGAPAGVVLGGTLGVAPPPVPLRATNTLRWEADAGPFYMAGYYRPPASKTRDAAALGIVSRTLTGDASARLNKRAVSSGLASSVNAVAVYPGDKHPGMFLTVGVPSGSTSGAVDKVRDVFRSEFTSMAASGPTVEELAAAREAVQKDLLYAIDRDALLAQLLCKFHAAQGDWSRLLNTLEAIETVTARDITAVAQRTFTDDNRFEGFVFPPKAREGKDNVGRGGQELR